MPEEQFPLLFFPRPQLVAPPEVAARGFGGTGQTGVHLPSRERQTERLDPQFRELARVLENSAIQASSQAEGFAPESILVVQTRCSGLEFQRALNGIPGMEWLAEAELDEVDPDDDFFDERDRTKLLKGQILFSFSNQRAMQELLRLWNVWTSGGDMGRGQTVWRDIFSLMDTIRPWSLKDRLEEFGILDIWRHDLEADPRGSRIFEIELWYRNEEEARDRAVEQVSRAIADAGGRILRSPVLIEDIRFFAVKAELPGVFLAEWMNRWEDDPGPFGSFGIRYLRPMGCSVAQGVATLPCEEGAGEISGKPLVAVLDGLPLEGHIRIRDRIQVYDLFGLRDKYASPSEQRHGTSMCSIVSWGDLNAARPLRTPVACIPILEPDPSGRLFGRSDERIDAEAFPEDLVYRAIEALLRPTAHGDAIAPSVKVVNLSVGDSTKPFNLQASSWARLIDWLSWKHKILFLVAAGNKNEIDLDVAPDQLESFGPQQRTQTTLSGMVAARRKGSIHSPAEAINALTIGSLHSDASPQADPGSNRLDILPDHRFPSPITRNGPGFKRGLKPELLFPGGRVYFQKGLRHYSISEAGSAPGVLVAAPSGDGQLDRALYRRGTSNAAALASNAAARIGELLLELGQDPTHPIPSDNIAPLIKAMLVHGARKGDLRQAFNSARGEPRPDGRHDKEFSSNFLGFGTPNVDQVLRCTSNRATVIGTGSIPKMVRGMDTLHEYVLPLPASMAGVSAIRRLTVTLAWLSPVAPRHKDYRQAKLAVEFERAPAGVESGENNRDHIARGTVWHNVFEGNPSDLFSSGSELKFNIVCSERAGHLDEEIPYGFAVSFEVVADLPIYAEIRQLLQVVVSARVRA